MEFRIQVTCVDDNGAACQSDVLVLRRDEPLAMDTLGLTLDDGKQLLRGLQRYVVDQQAAAYLARHQGCPHCGRRFAIKERGYRSVQTVYGPCVVHNPRWHRCGCEGIGAKTFRPTAAWLTNRASPELLYVETRWASLIPFAKVVDLLRDVLPVSNTLNPETVRQHLHATATRVEHALGDEQPNLFEGAEEDWDAQPCPDEPMTVGIDGGMLRARGKAGFFEAIAGKSVVAFRRDDAEDVPSARRFAFV